MKKISQIIGLGLGLAIALTGMASAQTTVTTSTPVPTSGGGGSTSNGDVPDSSPAITSVPIMSPRTLKAYALANVNELSGQVSGDSVSGTPWFYVGYPFQDADPDHMAAVMKSHVLRFDADPTEELESHVGYHSTRVIPNWNFEMFWGYAKFKLKKTDSGWQVPREAYQIQLDLSDWLPLRIPGLRYAYIITQDENGNDQDYYNFSWDGRINDEYDLLYLGRVHVNQRGKLYIVLDGGDRLVYNLQKEGEVITPVTPAPDGFIPSIKGVRTLPVGTSTVVYNEGDELVRVGFEIETKVSVTFPPALGKYPTSVHSVVAAALATNPFTQWRSHSIFEPILIEAGRGGVIIRFEYGEAPEDLPQPSEGGKG